MEVINAVVPNVSDSTVVPAKEQDLEDQVLTQIKSMNQSRFSVKVDSVAYKDLQEDSSSIQISEGTSASETQALAESLLKENVKKGPADPLLLYFGAEGGLEGSNEILSTADVPGFGSHAAAIIGGKTGIKAIDSHIFGFECSKEEAVNGARFEFDDAKGLFVQQSEAGRSLESLIVREAIDNNPGYFSNVAIVCRQIEGINLSENLCFYLSKFYGVGDVTVKNAHKQTSYIAAVSSFKKEGIARAGGSEKPRVLIINTELEEKELVEVHKTTPGLPWVLLFDPTRKSKLKALDCGIQSVVLEDFDYNLPSVAQGGFPAVTPPVKKVYLLFGPAGVGKSTITEALSAKLSGDSKVFIDDLESGGDTFIKRYEHLLGCLVKKDAEVAVLGAADFNPENFKSTMYMQVIWIDLVMDEDAYVARRASRDAEISGKASQKITKISEFFKSSDGANHLKVDVSGTLDETCAKIIELVK